MRPAKAYELLNLSPDATPSAVKAAWRDARSTAHPDRGGNAEVFAELREAYAVAYHDARKPMDCPACEGTGRIVATRGWAKTKLRCAACNGTGEVYREPPEADDEP